MPSLRAVTLSLVAASCLTLTVAVESTQDPQAEVQNGSDEVKVLINAVPDQDLHKAIHQIEPAFEDGIFDSDASAVEALASEDPDAASRLASMAHFDLAKRQADNSSIASASPTTTAITTTETTVSTTPSSSTFIVSPNSPTNPPSTTSAVSTPSSTPSSSQLPTSSEPSSSPSTQPTSTQLPTSTQPLTYTQPPTSSQQPTSISPAVVTTPSSSPAPSSLPGKCSPFLNRSDGEFCYPLRENHPKFHYNHFQRHSALPVAFALPHNYYPGMDYPSVQRTAGIMHTYLLPPAPRHDHWFFRLFCIVFGVIWQKTH